MATSITAAIGAGDRWLAVNAASTKAVPFYFTIDAEVFACKSGAQTLVWECERGQNGTGAVAHAINSTLIEDVTAIESAASGYTSATAPGDLPATGVGLGLWANAKAAGDHRTIYSRLYFAFASASGEAIRAFGTVLTGITAAVGGTVNGLHATLSIQGTGQVSGSGNAIRATLGMDASANPGGTLAVIRADTDLGTSATVPARTAFLATDNLGTPKLDYLLNITNASTNMVANAGTGANSAAVSTGGVAAKVIKVSVAGVDYWLPLYSSNS